MKTTIMCGLSKDNLTRQIAYLGHLFCGKVHDYTMLKSEFEHGLDWFSDHHIRLDLGYLGFDKTYSCGAFSLPIKSSKKKPLSDEDRAKNRLLAGQRIVVEHVIGGMKRYRVLTNRVRSRKWTGFDTKVEVGAGLWNFYVTN